MRRALAYLALWAAASCGRSGFDLLGEESPAGFPHEFPEPETGLLFDGGDGATADHPAFDLDAFTLEAWARPDNVGNEIHILSHHDNTNNEGWLLMIRGQRAAFRVYDGTTQYNVDATGPALVPGEWHHFAGTFDGSQTLSIYVDGLLLATALTPAPVTPQPSDNPMGIGISAASGGFRFNGVIDEARVSNGLRYQGSFERPGARFSPDASTVCLWHLDEADRALDSGPNGLHLQLGDTAGADGADPLLVPVPPISLR